MGSKGTDVTRDRPVDAVVVLYHPDAAMLSAVLEAVAPQVDRLLLVANDGASPPVPLPQKATVIRSDKNLGLGAAYNLAAEWAQAGGATHLLLLDQDSVPAPGMVEALMDAFGSHGPLAAAGPLWRDARTGRDGFFVRFSPWGVHSFCPPDGGIVPVDFLISSGSLIALSALDKIGKFDEGLFIDHVDTDWCLRARAHGFRLCGVGRARLNHTFGEATLSMGPGASYRFVLYSPERNHTLVRNSIVLWRRPYAPWRWILYDVRRTLLIVLFNILFAPPRKDRIRQIAWAVRDALTSGAATRTGKMEN